MRVGDWVEVRSEVEILQTLDEQGRLEGLPFMPEMFRFCGQRLQIYKCAHKTCDGISQQSRRLARTVHLETRCSGEAHGGCQSACLLFWKEDWLRPVKPAPVNSGHFKQAQAGSSGALSLLKGAVVNYAVVQEGNAVRYRCQATQIRDASGPLPWWDLRQYLRDLRSGNVNVWTFTCGVLRALRLAMGRLGFAAVRIVRSFYGRVRSVRKGRAFPSTAGRIPPGQRTPIVTLNLEPGEMVRIRSVGEIDRTLDTGGHNRGLYFDPEQAQYAERIFRVGGRVQRMISEQTGRMIEIKTPTVVLESVFCQGRYCPRRTFCPRSAYLFWREAWLERVNETPSQCEPLAHSHRETERMPHENSGEQQIVPEDC